MDWNTLPKPAEHVENQLITALLNGVFPIGSMLPAERELAVRLGVTRPTLREALQRLARDGWVEIHQGKPTRVRDYWREGSLGVLNALAHRPWAAPQDFIPNLLSIRLALAPAYTRLAVETCSSQVLDLMAASQALSEEPQTARQAEVAIISESYAAFDWRLHHGLTILSGNPIFTLIINGFSDLYPPLAQRYFCAPEARQASQVFYSSLAAAARDANGAAAEDVTRAAMQASLDYWLAGNHNA